MVHGLNKFKEYFTDLKDQYVFIGGTACDLLISDQGGDFRGTKDLDIVLIIEALDASFAKVFWNFICDGGYEHRSKSDRSGSFTDLVSLKIQLIQR